MTSSPRQPRARDAWLTHIRQQLGLAANASPPATIDIDESLVRRQSAHGVTAAFVRAAERAGCCVHEVTPERLLSRLVELCRLHRARRVAVQSNDADALRHALAALDDGIDWRGDRGTGDGLGPLYTAHMAITDVAAAVAETGSLVMTPSLVRSRGAFLVAPIHVAIVRAEQILPDLIDYLDAPARDVAASVIVTGPSKTADIEGVLITGVHGPGTVHVIVVD